MVVAEKKNDLYPSNTNVRFILYEIHDSSFHLTAVESIYQLFNRKPFLAMPYHNLQTTCLSIYLMKQLLLTSLTKLSQGNKETNNRSILLRMVKRRDTTILINLRRLATRQNLNNKLNTIISSGPCNFLRQWTTSESSDTCPDRWDV